MPAMPPRGSFAGLPPTLPPLDGARLRLLPAGRAHARPLQALLEGAADEFERSENRRPSSTEAEELLSEPEADDRRRVYLLVPREGGPLAGVLDLAVDYPEPGTAQIALLLLRAGAQGRGYGREAAAAVERAVLREGCRALRVAVRDANGGALLFWERLGFAPVGRVDGATGLYEKLLG